MSCQARTSCSYASLSDLHHAAKNGSIGLIIALLSRESTDIDQGVPAGRRQGWTPLMFAASAGHARVVRILLNKGANVSIVADDGNTALLNSASQGHLVVTELLLKAGADPEATDSLGLTPLNLAAGNGDCEVVRALIAAGAHPDSRPCNGSTSLLMAVVGGHMDVLKVLLLAKANPLLLVTAPAGKTSVPLDAAAQYGRSEMVGELIRQFGIEGCGGPSGGADALVFAAREKHVDIMAMLTEAGVVDTGQAITHAAMLDREVSVKFLLQQREKRKTSGEGGAYAKTWHRLGCNALVYGICCSASPRIVRMLVDAEADTASTVTLPGTAWGKEFAGTPLAVANFCLRHKKIDFGKDATEEQLRKLENIRRLLLQIEAVHAVSWLWPCDVPVPADAEELAVRKRTTSPPLTAMLPILRLRAGRRGLPPVAMFR